MKKFSKIAIAGILAMSVTSTGLIAPFTVAEAGLGSLGKVITGGNSSSEQVDVEGLKSSQKKMLQHLYYSVALMQIASENALNAANENSNLKDDRAAMEVAKSFQNDPNGINGFKDTSDKTAADLKAADFNSILKNGTPERLEAVDKQIKTSNQQRLLSDTIAAWAGVEAGKIIKSVKNPLKVSDDLQKLIKTAQNAQSLLKIRSKLSKQLSASTKSYKSARGISDPPKSDVEKQANQMSPQ